MNTRIANYFFLLSSLVLTGYLLAVGQGILIPFVIAVFFWYLINALSHKIADTLKMPEWASLALAMIFVTGCVIGLGNLVTNNVQSFIDQIPLYQENITKMTGGFIDRFSNFNTQSLKELVAKINLGAIVGGLIAAISNVATMAITILLYVIFLFLEQKTFDWKLKALIKDKKKLKSTQETISDIGSSIESYIGLKTVLSLLMGFIGYLILIYFGVNNAVFWGLIIAILNFIPYIGIVLAVVLPALAALVQLADLNQIVIISILLSINAVFIGNVVEPKAFGQSLNLSPIVLMLSLSVWGALWGMTGMILCIPIMVSIMIVLDQFDTTRPYAILMRERE